MVERKWWEKRPEALEMTHYRTEGTAYLDAWVTESELVELGWEAQLVWLRLVTGPEHQPEGFPVDQLPNVFERPQEINYQAALEALINAQMVADEGEFLTFPNVVWGRPPQDEED